MAVYLNGLELAGQSQTEICNETVQSIAKSSYVTLFVRKRNALALAWQVKKQVGGSPVFIKEQERRELERHIKCYERELLKLCEMLEKGNPAQIRAKQNAIGNSYKCAKVAVLVWAERYGIKLSYNEICSIAERVKFSYKCSEKIWVKKQLKDNGGYRTVFGFGRIRRSRAIIAGDIFSICSEPNPYEFCRGGYGSKKAISIVRVKIDEGYIYWAVLDVKVHMPTKLTRVLLIGVTHHSC